MRTLKMTIVTIRHYLHPKCPFCRRRALLGDGLWGNRQPKHHDSLFWVQCSVTYTPATLQSVMPLLQVLKKPIWNKKSASGYHCLIGPYSNYHSAAKALKQARSVHHFERSALREVDSATLLLKQRTQPPLNRLIRQFSTSSYQVVVPFSARVPESLYQEKGEVWSRMSYQDALEACREQNLTLPDDLFWQEVNVNEIMNTHSLPSAVPYWGKEKQAYFSSGAKASSTEASLLNVICVGRH